MSVVSELVLDVSGIGAGVGCQWYRSWCLMSVVSELVFDVSGIGAGV